VVLVDPREHVIRETDCSLLLARHQRRLSRPPQDFEPL
jgi:hypothetical protein